MNQSLKEIRLFLLFFIFCLATAAKAQKSYLIKAGKLYDAEKNVFTSNQQILVTGNKIVAVGTNLKVPKETVILDYSKGTVTPGLIDAHTHLLTLQKMNTNLAEDAMMNSSEKRVLRAAGQARSFLEAGFTTIRDLGNSGYYLDVELKRAINNGYVPGPRMYVSGPILSAIDGQFFQLPPRDQEEITAKEYRVIKGVDDARLAVKEHVNNFVDVIKIVVYGERLGLADDEMKAIVETAHHNRLKVTAHATSDWMIRSAIAAGVDGIEHAYQVEDSTLQLMKAKGIYLVPTDPSIGSYIQGTIVMNTNDYDVKAFHMELEPLRKRLKRAFDQGVTIVAGSDMYIDIQLPQGKAAKFTLEGYFDSGLTPAQVLQTATINAAAVLGKSGQLGVIKENALADLVIFDGDLEKDFRKVLFEVELVFKDGRIVFEEQQ